MPFRRQSGKRYELQGKHGIGVLWGDTIDGWDFEYLNQTFREPFKYLTLARAKKVAREIIARLDRDSNPSDKWLKCSAVRILNGKLQIRNPGGFWDRLFQQKSGGASKRFNKHYTKGYFDKEESREIPVKAKPLSLTTTDNEVIGALVSQGAKKQQAKIAVQAAKARGASGFDGIFRGALKELT